MRRSGGGGTKVASASVHPAGPIQFWLRRNPPGVAASPRAPRMSRWCSSRTSRNDVVGDLAQVSGAARDGGTSLGREQFAEGRLRPFDATREHRLAPDEGAD